MIVSRWASQEAGKDPNSTAEELTETANRLLHRPFITRSDLGGAAHFERVQRHLDYFQELFAYSHHEDFDFVVRSADILVDEEEIQTVYSSFGARRLKPGELREILTQFRRRGLVSFDQTHSLNVDVEVSLRPTLLEVVDESFLARIGAWRDASSTQPETAAADEEHPLAAIEVDADAEAADTRRR